MNCLRVWVGCATILCLAFCLSGCFQSETMIYVNPDGSGRVVMTNLLSEDMLSMMAFMEESVEEMAEEMADEMGGEAVALSLDVAASTI